MTTAAAASARGADDAEEERRLEKMESEMDRIKARLKMYEDPPPLADMDVRVDGFVWHGSALAKHCRYKIRRSWEGQSLTVYRRFSDFVFLYAKLVADFPGAVVPYHPEKKMIYQGALAGDVLAAERAQWFQAFLRSAVQHKGLGASQWLRDFLQMATEDWQARCDEDATSDTASGAGKDAGAGAGSGTTLGALSEVAAPGMLETSAQASLHQIQQLAPDVSSFKSMVSGWSSSVVSSITNLSSRARASSVDSSTSSTPTSSTPGSPAARSISFGTDDTDDLDEAGDGINAAAAGSASKNLGRTVDSQYVRLCWPDRHLHVARPALVWVDPAAATAAPSSAASASSLSATAASAPASVSAPSSGASALTAKKPKMVQVTIEAREGRLRAMERLSRASLDHVRRSSEYGACLQAVSSAAKDLGAAEDAGAQSLGAAGATAKAGHTGVGPVIASLSAGLDDLAGAYVGATAQARLAEAIEPVLESTLVMQGAQQAYQRLLRARDRQKRAKGPISERADEAALTAKEDALANDLQSHSQELQPRLAIAMKALADAEIARARENQRALKLVLEALRASEASDAEWGRALATSRERTRIEVNSWCWGPGTPM